MVHRGAVLRLGLVDALLQVADVAEDLAKRLGCGCVSGSEVFQEGVLFDEDVVQDEPHSLLLLLHQRFLELGSQIVVVVVHIRVVSQNENHQVVDYLGLFGSQQPLKVEFLEDVSVGVEAVEHHRNVLEEKQYPVTCSQSSSFAANTDEVEQHKE